MSKAQKSVEAPLFRNARGAWPRWVALANRVGGWVHRPAPLDAAEIWERARGGALADVEPAAHAREALAVLVADLNAHQRWTTIGALSARDDTLRLARTHLRVERALRERSELARTELPPPVYIIGWPRTGSTFLHQLLAADPRFRTIPYWESFDPVPPPDGSADERRAALDRMLALLARLAPAYDAIHPMTADSVEECVALFMNVFRSHQLSFQYEIPRYSSWLAEQDAGIAYDAYREQLGLLYAARPGGEHLLLKDPTHLLHLETILDRFPDARFVFTHRNPAEALSSFGSLIAYTRALFSDRVDPRAIGAELRDGPWMPALAASRAFRNRLRPGHAVDVRHEELRADPAGTVAAIYRGLELPYPDGSRKAIEAELGRPATRTQHHHQLSNLGLEVGELVERMPELWVEFGWPRG